MNGALSLGVGGFVALLCAALVLSIAAERVRLPAAVLLVGAGALVGTLGHVRPPFDFGPALFFVFLPPLVFEAAWNIDLASLRGAALRIAILALPGTLLTALLVAVALAAAQLLPFGAALLFGAIVSATDPVAVIAVFRKIDVPLRVKTIVEAESLSNDGVAVVVYGIALVAAGGGAVALGPALFHGAVEILFGIAIGVACAVPVWATLKATDASEYEVTGTVALAYAVYLIADRTGVSGIFATASAAIALRALLAGRAPFGNRDDVDVFWNAGAYIANATVFLATGLLIDVPRSFHEPALVAVAIAAIAISRATLACIAARDTPARTTVFLAGMRGALPLALALGLPSGLKYRSEIIDGVFATVLVTLVLQGAALEPMVRRAYRGTRKIPNS